MHSSVANQCTAIQSDDVQVAQKAIKALFRYDLLNLFYEFLQTEIAVNSNINDDLQMLCECLYLALVVSDPTDDLIT